MLEKWRKTRQNQDLRIRVQREWEANPLWRVTVFETHWFCPYCGQVGVRCRPGAILFDRIQTHLLERCEVFAGVGPDVVLTLAELQDRALRFFVTSKISDDRAWQHWDDQGRWYCPYCGEGAFKAGLQIASLDHETITAATEHLSRCGSYAAGAGAPLGDLELKGRLVEAGAIRQLLQKILPKVQKRTLWRVVDGDGAWACPYCTVAVPGVEFREEIDLIATTEAIARHLVRSCAGYRDKREPVRTARELALVAFGTSPGTTAGDSEPIERVEALGTITEQIRLAEVQVARQENEIERSLEKARRMQRGMLPTPPNFPGFGFEVFYRPCGHLAGDFYDFIQLSDDRLGIVIGDVSGHGVDAALVMGIVKKVLNMSARFHADPFEAVKAANAEIGRDLEKGMFVTAWYGVFDRADRVLRFIRAGHQPAFLFNPSRRPRVTEYRPRGMALGIDPGPVFQKSCELGEVRLCVGDRLLLFTDGLDETKSADGEEFGYERIRAVLTKYGDAGVDKLVTKLERISTRFRGRGVPTDDLTIVAIEVQE